MSAWAFKHLEPELNSSSRKEGITDNFCRCNDWLNTAASLSIVCNWRMMTTTITATVVDNFDALPSQKMDQRTGQSHCQSLPPLPVLAATTLPYQGRHTWPNGPIHVHHAPGTVAFWPHLPSRGAGRHKKRRIPDTAMQRHQLTLWQHYSCAARHLQPTCYPADAAHIKIEALPMVFSSPHNESEVLCMCPDLVRFLFRKANTPEMKNQQKLSIFLYAQYVTI